MQGCLPHGAPARRAKCICCVAMRKLGHPERLHVGDVRVHLPWLLGVRRALEDHPDAVDLEFLNGLFEITSGRNQARRAGSHSLAEKTEPPIPPTRRLSWFASRP